MSNKKQIDHEIAKLMPSVGKQQITDATTSLLAYISDNLIQKRRVEIRNFGSFSIRQKNVFLAGGKEKGTRTTQTVYFRMSKNFI